MLTGDPKMRKRGQSNIESSIPLILIVILAVFVAAKFGFIDVSGIPILNQIIPAPTIKVAVVGRASAGLKAMLEAEDFRMSGVYYAGDLKQEILYPGVLNNFDIVILENTATCDRVARRVIADKVKSGGKLIIVGDACTRVSDDPNALGWDVGIGTMGDIVPATIGGVTHEREPIRKIGVSGKFKIIDPFHPIFNGIKNYGFSGDVVKVYPKADANVLAFVDLSPSGKVTEPAMYAILESRAFIGGKVVFLAYNPTERTSRNMFLNTLIYLKGSKG